MLTYQHTNYKVLVLVNPIMKVAQIIKNQHLDILLQEWKKLFLEQCQVDAYNIFNQIDRIVACYEITYHVMRLQNFILASRVMDTISRSLKQFCDNSQQYISLRPLQAFLTPSIQMLSSICERESCSLLLQVSRTHFPLTKSFPIYVF